MQLFPVAVVLILLGVIAYHHCWGRFLFLVRIRDGHPLRIKGRLGRGFLQDLSEICEQSRLQHGLIGATRYRDRIRFVFSRHIAPGIRQQVRNTWNAGR